MYNVLVGYENLIIFIKFPKFQNPKFDILQVPHLKCNKCQNMSYNQGIDTHLFSLTYMAPP